MDTVHSQSSSPFGSHKNTHILWMWNIIMHEIGTLSVSYEPAMKPPVDKSPPTGVQEFGSLMKKSCWESWEELAYRALGFLSTQWGPGRRGAVEQNRARPAGPAAWLQFYWSGNLQQPYWGNTGDSAEQEQIWVSLEWTDVRVYVCLLFIPWYDYITVSMLTLTLKLWLCCNLGINLFVFKCKHRNL